MLILPKKRITPNNNAITTKILSETFSYTTTVCKRPSSRKLFHPCGLFNGAALFFWKFNTVCILFYIDSWASTQWDKFWKWWIIYTTGQPLTMLLTQPKPLVWRLYKTRRHLIQAYKIAVCHIPWANYNFLFLTWNYAVNFSCFWKRAIKGMLSNQYQWNRNGSGCFDNPGIFLFQLTSQQKQKTFR